MEKTRTSNQEVGRLVGLDHSTVSRLRAGLRLPNLETMQLFANSMAWDLDEQIKVRNDPEQYACGLESAIERFFAQPAE